ncbi:MAG: Na+-translocating NADH-quinone reductase subunit C [Rhodospirillaceae bacterium]|nr:Na+-translocating NADH-quinone reductase subunit C [Rhodospirillaceae bacterium]MBT5243387.1 Na+-translocating NADH-quinone reductase subunit C [Rhodospirillaceae bacterium]MBT5561292.1 Na+-translocating NADH-quinone reductase subunit C [Rhodospirillaceae bacterium]MBT6243367.1 Na+-translocating NADH-quinone reductase subunit C [Rhodospirillaceae bacterium]MBT7139013.1 Na+-translocating NADH-quinone reductase subunit C [Rhodospirillaceae bacterium]
MGNPISLWRSFLALPNDHPGKIIGMAFIVAAIASFFVSLTAVTLQPLRDANRERASKAGMLAIVEQLGVKSPEARFVELSSGKYVKKASSIWRQVPPSRDPARIGQMEDVATVYEVRDGERLTLVILPVRGKGYKSTLKGFLALEGDLNTVAAVKFHDHDETPGFGANIEKDSWTGRWPGREIADASGKILIEVVKGRAKGIHEVDGISGATRTGSGISRLMRFWLGPDAYGPYLARLGSGESK